VSKNPSKSEKLYLHINGVQVLQISYVSDLFAIVFGIVVLNDIR
jgi:hypothetical protein